VDIDPGFVHIAQGFTEADVGCPFAGCTGPISVGGAGPVERIVDCARFIVYRGAGKDRVDGGGTGRVG